ncbi:MAG: ThiF family adenylyltransferase [Bacteroidota bacterium]
MSWWKPEKVQKAQVMVVGAGALGNEVLKNLALMNVGHILIVDFDIIEYANLCRSVLFRESDLEVERKKAEVAAERIREINPNVKVMTIHGDIGVDVGLGIFRRMDAIIGCLDNRLARLFINQLAFKVNKPWIDGAIQNLIGWSTVYWPGKSCYQCGLTESEEQHIRSQLSCADIAERYASAGRVPTTPVISSIIGGVQVQEALKLIHGNEKQSLAGQIFYYEGHSNTTLQFKSDPLKEFCESHFPFDEIIEAAELGAESTLAELFAWLQARFPGQDLHLELDHGLVTKVSGAESEKEHEVIISKPHFSEAEQRKYQSVPGEILHFEDVIQTISSSFQRSDLRLREIGIPPLHILTIVSGQETYFVELTGDLTYLNYS